MPPRTADTVDRLLLETLRSDAMQIRVVRIHGPGTVRVFKASEGVRINAFRAASMYTGMAARMTHVAARACEAEHGSQFRSCNVIRSLLQTKTPAIGRVFHLRMAAVSRVGREKSVDPRVFFLAQSECRAPAPAHLPVARCGLRRLPQ